MSNKIVLGFVFLLWCTGILSVQAQSLPLHQIDLKNLNGEHMTMDQIIPKDKNVIVSFWATWCGPCKIELDVIQSKYADWQEKYNVELIAISTDDARTAARVKAMVLQKQWSYKVYQDVKGQSRQVFNFESIPFTAILDTKGNVVYTHIGYNYGDEKELEKELIKLQ